MPRIGGALDIVQVSDPATPAAGRQYLYFKSDGHIYTKKPDGTVVQIDGGSSSAANGLPVGGTTGQALLKTSGTDYQASWQDLYASKNFTTPVGSSVPTKLLIPLATGDPYSQQVALGVPLATDFTARVLSLFDARTSTHQPTLLVFNPSEADGLGLGWAGGFSTGLLQTLSGNIGIAPAGTTGANVPLLVAQYGTSGRFYTQVTGTLALNGFDGANTAVRLVGGTAVGSPSFGSFQVGDVAFARDGRIWTCTVAGSPGTWVSHPAPSNMVTTDTSQIITAGKTFAGLTSDQDSILLQSANGGADNVNVGIGFRRNSTYGYFSFFGDASPFVSYFGFSNKVDAPLLTENGVRVYSSNNKVPVAGISATGTTDATTYLRGDGTWATPAGSGTTVTTDTAQTITAVKTFSVGSGGSGVLFAASTASSTNTTRATSSLGFYPAYWNAGGNFASTNFVTLAGINNSANVNDGALQVASGTLQISQPPGASTKPALDVFGANNGQPAIQANSSTGNIFNGVSAGSTVAEITSAGAIRSTVGLYDGASVAAANRVYSPANRVPMSGIFTTAGTASTTTFLRGDGTWAAPAGGSSSTVTSQTAAYTAVNGNVVLANGTFTVTLPAPTANAQITVKNTGTGTITVATGALIDGASTVVMANQYAALTVVSDGANWFIV